MDILKEAGGETYATLLADSARVEQAGYTIRCASLDALVRMKRAADRPKDRQVLAQLEEAARKQRKK